MYDLTTVPFFVGHVKQTVVLTGLPIAQVQVFVYSSRSGKWYPQPTPRASGLVDVTLGSEEYVSGRYKIAAVVIPFGEKRVRGPQDQLPHPPLVVTTVHRVGR